MVERDFLNNDDREPGGAGKVVDLFLQSTQQKIKEITLEKITPRKDQPRKEFKDIEELAASIKERGVIQPIRVKPADRPGHYEIIAGERRWRASKVAGKETIPCVVVDGLTDFEVRLEALIENIQRRNLTPIEKALAIKDLIEHSKETTGKALTLEEVGRRLGYGKARVHQLLSILRLPNEMRQAFCEAGLNEMHARALTQLKKWPGTQQELFGKIMEEKLTGQQAVDLASGYLKKLNMLGTPVHNLTDKMDTNISKVKNKWGSMNQTERQQVREELENLLKRVQGLLDELE